MFNLLSLLFSSPLSGTPTGGECGSSRGWHAIHAGDDGAVEPAAERAASSQSHPDCLTPLLWQSGTDRWPSSVWHRPLQKCHRGEWILQHARLPVFKWAPSCLHVCFSYRESHYFSVFKSALTLLEYFPNSNRRTDKCWRSTCPEGEHEGLGCRIIQHMIREFYPVIFHSFQPKGTHLCLFLPSFLPCAGARLCDSG